MTAAIPNVKDRVKSMQASHVRCPDSGMYVVVEKGKHPLPRGERLARVRAILARMPEREHAEVPF